jgi:hypothetical protein
LKKGQEMVVLCYYQVIASFFDIFYHQKNLWNLYFEQDYILAKHWVVLTYHHLPIGMSRFVFMLT